MNAKKKFFYLMQFHLLLLFIPMMAGAQLPYQIDSLHFALKHEKTDTGRARIYTALAWSNRVDSVNTALQYSKVAIEIYEKYRMQYEANVLCNRLGILYRNKGDYNTALENFYNVLNSQDSINSANEIAYAYNNISDIYNRLEKFEKAHQFAQLATDLFSKSGNLKGLAYTINLRGEIYRNEKDYKTALELFRKALSIRIKINHRDGMAASYYNIGECFFEMNMPDSALRAYEISTDIFKKAGFKHFGYNYIGFGKYYMLLGDYKQALQNLHTAYEISNKLNNPNMGFKAAGYLRKVYAHLGDFKNAYYYQTIEVEIIDSLIRKEYLNKITTLELNYNFEQKIKISEIEKIRNNAIYEGKLLQQKIITLGLAIIIFSVIVFVVILYRNYQKVSHLHSNLMLSTKKIESQKRAIEEKNIELQQLNATKDKFFSIIAHDLRNPFNGIIGLSSILHSNMRKMETENIEQLLESINEAAIGAHKLLENLLEWSLAQTGNIVYMPSEIKIRYSVVDIISMTSTIQENKKIKIYNEIPEDLEILADINMMHTILRNIIMNALKFTPSEGQIWIRSRRINNEVYIVIEDTGVGIPQEKLETLFDISKRNSTPGTNLEKGTGLGLLLCKEFVIKHNGRMEVESELDKGTKISIILPQ